MFDEVHQLSRKEWAAILGLFFLSKIFFVSVALLGYVIVPLELSQRKPVVESPFLNLFAQYDSASYINIAAEGYNSEFNQGNYNHYPVYPLLVRFLGYLVGNPLAAFVISNTASLFAILLIYLLLKDDMGATIAGRTIGYVLFFPTAYFLTVMYVEPLFLCLVALCFYCGRKGWWSFVGLFGVITSATKAFGFLLVIPLLYLYLVERGVTHWKGAWAKIDYRIVYVLSMPLGLPLFFGYLWYLTGDPFIHFTTHARYAAPLTIPFVSFYNELFELMTKFSMGIFQGVLYHSFNLVINILFIYLTWRSIRVVRPEYSLYQVVFGGLLFMHGTLESNSRFFLFFFPTFATLATLAENKRTRMVINITYLLFLFLFMLFVVRHVNYDINYYTLLRQTLSW